jgi:DNA-directed RNA polymerase subunit RPC12/RpoP
MIRFACSNCGRHISVDDKHSGKKGRCPKCEGVVVVPERSTIVEFDCQSCGHKIRVPETYAGRKGRCPKCKQPVVVPSLRKEPPERAGTLSVACLMCGAAIDVPGDSAEEYLECPECGAYVGISPDGVPAVSEESDGSMPSAPDEDLCQEGPEARRGPVSLDRRLIIVISGAAAIVVVGLVILIAVLRSSGSRPVTSNSQPMLLRVDQAQEFAEQYIGLLGNGELDEAHRLLSAAFADDVGRPQMERLSEQISKSGIVKMDCRWTHRQQHSEGDRVFLRYDLRYATGGQEVIISVIQIEQELMIDGVAARDVFGRTVSVGPYDFDTLSRVAATATSSERCLVSPTRLLQALVLVMAVGTVTSACCLWVGMKVTDVEGTFGALLGIAAICSLVGLVPFVGGLASLVVMFVLICKWTDADFWPQAIGMVLVAGLVGIFAVWLLRMFIVGV